MIKETHFAVISHNRTENIKKIEEITGLAKKLVWYVGEGEKKAYREIAQGEVIEGGKLVPSRNKALQIANAEGKYCLMMDDDLVECAMIAASGQVCKVKFETLAREMFRVLSTTPVYLAGVAPTPNPFFYNPVKPIGMKHFIGSWMMLIKQNELKFDEQLKTKEDYDYTLQHIKRYGGVARLNYLIPTFRHFGNKGGLHDIRNAEIEQDSIAKLRAKWGSSIQLNKKRPNEILLRVK